MPHTGHGARRAQSGCTCTERARAHGYQVAEEDRIDRAGPHLGACAARRQRAAAAASAAAASARGCARLGGAGTGGDRFDNVVIAITGVDAQALLERLHRSPSPPQLPRAAPRCRGQAPGAPQPAVCPGFQSDSEVCDCRSTRRAPHGPWAYVTDSHL